MSATATFANANTTVTTYVHMAKAYAYEKRYNEVMDQLELILNADDASFDEIIAAKVIIGEILEDDHENARAMNILDDLNSKLSALDSLLTEAETGGTGLDHGNI